MKSVCDYPLLIQRNLCIISLCQLIISVIVFVLLIVVGGYVSYKFRKRSFRTFLSFHNLRSASELLLLTINTFEFASACLPIPTNFLILKTTAAALKITPTTSIPFHSDTFIQSSIAVHLTPTKSTIYNDVASLESNLSAASLSSTGTQSNGHAFVILVPFTIWNSMFAVLSTLILIVYHRIVEIKSVPDFLYVSIGAEFCLLIIRIYKLTDVTQEYSIIELEPFFEAISAFFILIILTLDCFTIYKQRFKPKFDENKSTSDGQIVYNYSTSTFFSNIIFWWLTPLLWRGYHEPLEQEDLGQLLEEDSAKYHYDQFLLIYKTTVSNSKSPSLWLCYLKSCWKVFTLGGILKLFGDLSALIGPLSIHQIVDYIERQHNKTESKIYFKKSLLQNFNQPYSKAFLNNNENIQIYYPNWNELLSNGWVIAWLVLIASLAQGGLSQASTHLLNLTGIQIKTSLQGLIYRKTLLLNSSSLNFHTDESNDKNHLHSMKIQKEKGTNNNYCAKDAGAITNLMSEDALNVMSFFWIAHYVWAIPLKIGLVMYLLYLKLGISAIIGSFVCILTMTPLQFLIGKAMSKNSKKAAECTDERLKKTNDIFLGIKIIKLNAWENVFQDKLLECRNKELKYLNKDSIYWTLMTFLTHVSSVLITFVTLAVYITLEAKNFVSTDRRKSSTIFDSSIFSSNEFTASRLFSALALFNQLTVPLLIFPITIPIIISAIVSTKRLERFLNEQEVQKEFEGVRNMARILSKSDASLDMYEKEDTIDNNETIIVKNDSEKQLLNNEQENEADPIKKPSLKDAKKIKILPVTVTPFSTKIVKISSPEMTLINNERKATIKSKDNEQSITTKCNQNYDTNSDNIFEGKNYQLQQTLMKRSGKELIRNSRVEKPSLRQRHQKSTNQRNRDSFQFQTSNSLAVTIHNAIFSWDNCNTMLKVDNVQIPKGKLTVIVGKSGSGKTSFLAALLREMQQISGEVIWNKLSTTAYVPQTPWLLNSSIRENILFGESFRPKRYEKVLEACALKPDIELMPENDMTVIGERGINLSGGQKQRIVIARSLYSSANVIIMDDPLSSLDNEVGKHVFENGIKKMLLKANRTVIMVTQKLQLTCHSDYIIAMKDGYVQCSGSLNEIERQCPELISEWNTLTNKEKHESSPGKTARERWKLYKNVSKIGLYRTRSVEHDENGSLPSLYKQNIRRASIYGSRHLIYDIPLPIDECQNDDVIIQRRICGSHRRSCINHSMDFRNAIGDGERKGVLRVNSLQPQNTRSERQPVVRNVSSPTSFYDSKSRAVENEFKSKSGFRQFLYRMSSRKSNTATVSARIHRAISLSNSIQSISEESHQTLKRSSSEASSEFLDDESIQEDYSDANLEGNIFYDEERKYGEIPLDIYILYLKSCGLTIVCTFFIGVLLSQALRVYTDIWLRYWTDDSNGAQKVSYYFNKYTYISVICILLSLISTPTGQWAGCNARRLIYEKLLKSILSKSVHFFQVTPFGRIMNRFSNDMATIDKKIAATSIRLLHFSVLCLSAMLINIAITPWFTLVTIPIGFAYYGIQKFYRCSSRELQRIENITNSPVISHFTETIQGVTTIRAYSQESRFTEILFRRLEANTVAFIILNTSNRWLGIALDYLGGVIVFIAIITALIVAETSTKSNSQHTGTSDEDKSFLSPSLVGLAINYTLLIPIYLNWVVKLLADMEMYVGSVERVAYYSNNEKNVSPSVITESPSSLLSSSNNGENNLQEMSYKPVPISWPQKGDVIFENVCLRYQGQKQNVIQDLSLIIPAGQKLGICGRTGSGKSSLALSLFSVLEIVQGRILIDNVSISQIHPDEIRSRLSIIPQDVHLFNASIRENLDPHGYFSDLELWNCLELAQLKDFVNSMPFGLDTEIIESGGNLSAGHRQLFCLARAVLRGSVCLILDEATSSLDSQTENALLEVAHQAFKNRTIITIAHRLSTLLNYDRIIVLENGIIVEDGTPKDLQQIVDGKFVQMLKSGNT